MCDSIYRRVGQYSINTAQDVINISQRYKVPIFIIGIGDVDVSTMNYIASQTGGRYYGINQIFSMQNIYNEIYRMEKDLYLIEFTDSTGGGVFSESEILLGYNSAEYGGRTNYLYTPHTLVNVREQGLYADGPAAVVEGYIKGWDNAITYSDFSYISDYLKMGSPIYEMQRKYIMQNISEQLDSYEIVDINYQNATRCIITTNETFFVQLPNQPLKLLTQQCKYVVIEENGRWYMIDFVGSPTILSKIYY